MSIPEIIDMLQKQVSTWRKRAVEVEEREHIAATYRDCADDLESHIDEIWPEEK